MRWIVGCVVIGGCVGSEVCREVGSEVVGSLREVADAHRSCAVDQDCELVILSGDCFSSCQWVVGVGGAVAVADAIAEANDGICRDYPTCDPYAPPCAPLADPVCVAGTCQEPVHEEVP